MYSETLLEHFKNPRNAGVLPPPAARVTVQNPACGDLMALMAESADGRIVRCRFQVKGCTASIAAGSVLTEWLTGRSIDELPDLRAADIESGLGGLPAASKHAAALCVDAARALWTRLSTAS